MIISLYAILTFYGERLEVSQHNILSIEGQIMDRKDIELPSWGLISNGGSIKLNDFDGKIQSLAESNVLNKETKAKIYIKNTLSGNSILVGDFFASKWNYDDDSKVATATLDDGLEKMQTINIVPMSKDAESGGTITADKMYEFLHTQTTSNGFNMVAFSDLDELTQTHLQNYTIHLAYIEQKTLWRAWQEFCEALQLYIFKNQSGTIVCVYKEGE